MKFECKHLYKVGKIYYFRLRIPVTHSNKLQADSIRMSLRTDDLTVAVKRSNLLVSLLKGLFNRDKGMTLSMSEIKALGVEYLDYLCENDEAIRALATDTVIAPQTEENAIRVLTSILEDEKKALTTNDISKIKSSIDSFLKLKDLLLSDFEYKQFSREALKAHVEATKISIARSGVEGFENHYDVPLAELSRQKRLSSQQKPIPVSAVPEPDIELQQPVISLKNLVDEYIADGKTTKFWTEKTTEGYQSTLDILLESLGENRDISAVTHNDLKQFRDNVLMKLPAKRKLKPAYREKTISEILAMTPPPEPMSRTAQDNKIKDIIAFFNWCYEHEHIDRNPAHHLRIGRGIDPRDARKPYSKEDLEKLLSALAAMQKNEHFDYRYWITLIALFSGARQDEVCQLRVQDVKEQDGILIFDLANIDSDQKLKTTSSHRIIPIHPTLIDLGFMAYYRKIKRAKHEQLWPLLTRTRDGYSKKLVRWFTGKDGFNRKHVTDDPKKAFHSFRHTFITNLRLNKVPLDMISEIVGHKKRSQTINYTDVYPPEELLEGMKKLDYGIDVFTLLGKKRPQMAKT